MIFILKLLKDWTDPSKKEWKAGQVIQIDDADIAGKLLLDGTAQKTDSEPIETKTGDKAPGATINLDKTIADGIKKALESEEVTKAFTDQTAEKVHEIQMKDLSDDDLSYGYLPQTAGREHTADEKQWGLGVFAADIFKAGAEMVRPSERLTKCIERSENVIKNALSNALINKAAGDGMTYSTDSQFGALIPPEFNTMLLDRAGVSAIIRPRATVVPVSSPQIQFPRLKNYDHSSNLIYGGMLAAWEGEDDQLSPEKLKHEQLELNLHGLKILAYVSGKAMNFTPFDMGGYLLPKMADAITWKEEDGFINGTGAGMPLGLLVAPCRRAITAETGQTSTANVIHIKNIDNMEARVHVERPASVVWIYNRPELFVWLRNLSRVVGTGGEISKIFEFAGFGAGAQSNLDGIPILDTEHIPAAATEGDLTLTDLSQYVIADDRKGPAVAQSMHLKFDYDQMAFRIVKYVDGQPANSTYFTRQKGSNTLASIMTIATRS